MARPIKVRHPLIPHAEFDAVAVVAKVDTEEYEGEAEPRKGILNTKQQEAATSSFGRTSLFKKVIDYHSRDLAPKNAVRIELFVTERVVREGDVAVVATVLGGPLLGAAAAKVTVRIVVELSAVVTLPGGQERTYKGGGQGSVRYGTFSDPVTAKVNAAASAAKQALASVAGKMTNDPELRAALAAGYGPFERSAN